MMHPTGWPRFSSRWPIPLVDEFDLIEFLRMVTAQTSDLLGARAAGLLLSDPHGRLQLLAASDERAEMLELFQVQAMEGPCQDCYRQGGSGGQRRPSARCGALAVVRAAGGGRGLQVGACLPFASEASGHQCAEFVRQRARRDFAGRRECGAGSGGCSHDRASPVARHPRGPVLTGQLQSVLNTRIVIGQAKGALAQIHGGTPDEAYERLRAHCRKSRLRLSDVALAVMTYAGSVPDLSSP